MVSQSLVYLICLRSNKCSILRDHSVQFHLVALSIFKMSPLCDITDHLSQTALRYNYQFLFFWETGRWHPWWEAKSCKVRLDFLLNLSHSCVKACFVDVCVCWQDFIFFLLWIVICHGEASHCSADQQQQINYHSLRQTRLCQPLLSEAYLFCQGFACLIITVFMSAVIVSTQEGLLELEEIGFLCCINSLIFNFLWICFSPFFAFTLDGAFVSCSSFFSSTPLPFILTVFSLSLLHCLISCIYFIDGLSPCLW